MITIIAVKPSLKEEAAQIHQGSYRDSFKLYRSESGMSKAEEQACMRQRCAEYTRDDKKCKENDQ